MQLTTRGRHIVRGGVPVVLRGVNACGFEFDQHGQPASLTALSAIVERWGAAIVRLPFNQRWWLDSTAYRERIDERVAFLADRKVYTLLTLQWLDADDLRLAPLPDDESPALWTSVARHYARQPAALYDLYTEPHPTWPWTWRPWAMRLADAVRKVDPDTLMWVGGTNWGYDLRGFMLRPLPHDGVVYSTHIYPSKPGSGYWLPPLHDAYWGAMRWRGKPIFAGELGPRGGTEDHPRIEPYVRRLLDALERRGAGWTAWSWYCEPRLVHDSDPDRPTRFGAIIRARLSQA